jgi:molybdenum cofactor guanylyltransferase
MKVYGYVQAGGGSTRFGKDKALVEFSGRTMLRRTTDLVGSVCDEVKIVASAARYPESAAVIDDRWPGEGPLGGIITALFETRKIGSEPSWSLIVGCDMPFLTVNWLQVMKDRALKSPAQLVVPQSDSGLEPLCACWSSDSAPKLQEAFDAGVRKVSQAMKCLSMEVLDESVWKRFDSDKRLFWNMNTPEDYEEARRIIEKLHD